MANGEAFSNILFKAYCEETQHHRDIRAGCVLPRFVVGPAWVMRDHATRPRFKSNS